MDDLAAKMQWSQKWIDHRENEAFENGKEIIVRVANSGDRIVFFTVKTQRGIFADLLNLAFLSSRDIERQYKMVIEHMHNVYLRFSAE